MANTAFTRPEDVANRALQHCGVRRITSFTDDSTEASETSFAYDKVRQAELQRNIWKFATKLAAIRPIETTSFFPAIQSPSVTVTPYPTPTLLLVPALYDPTYAYGPGAIVADANGNLWSSTTQENINNTPGATGGTAWDTYFGPMSVQQWQTPLMNVAPPTYYAGELVYETDNLGHFQTYVSLVNGNTTDPGINGTTQWLSTTTFNQGDVVQGSNGWYYLSLINLNLGNDPTMATLPWNSGSPYSIGDLAAGGNGVIYESVTDDNVGNDPQADNGTNWVETGALQTWTNQFNASLGSDQWRQIKCTLSRINYAYPVGAGPSSQQQTRNVFMLPNGFLRTAPQDPKAGAVSYLGAPSGRQYDDWEIQDGFLISNFPGTIILRFIADVTQVTRMDPMFCEGLACRAANAVVERLTQSDSKIANIQKEYVKFMGEARLSNMIETGAVEPPVDDYIAARY